MKKKKNAITILVALLACLGFYLYGRYDLYLLKSNHKITIGQVIGCSSGGRGGWWHLDYVFQVGEKKVKGSFMLNTDKVSKEDYSTHFIGKSFAVVYYPPRPAISDMLISPSDFSRFEYEFPDSLKWVLPFFKE